MTRQIIVGGIPIGGGLHAGFLPQNHRSCPHPADLLRCIFRNPDESHMVGKIPGNALSDPLCRIGGKPELQCMVKFSGRCQKANAALLDQIQKGYAPASIFPGHGNHQPQIGIHHLADCLLVTFGASAGQTPLLFLRQPGNTTNLPEELAHIVFTGRNLDLPFQNFCHPLIPFLSFILFRMASISSSEATLLFPCSFRIVRIQS